MDRRGAVIVLAVSTLIAIAALGPSPASAALASASADRHCRNVSLRYDGAVLTATRGLTARRTTCTIARKVAHGWLSGAEGTVEPPHPLGFTCHHSSDGTRMTCARGAARVRWRYASASASAVAAGRVRAARAATGATRRAMVRAAQRYARSNGPYRSFHVARAVVSSVDRRWGAVRLVPPDGNSATVLLKRSGGHWTAKALGTAFECDLAPRGVVKDLLGSCYADGS